MNFVKYLQAQALGSRKSCRRLAGNGLVAVNGEVLDDEDADIDPAAVRSLTVDGAAALVIPLPFYYILLNKPAGFETSHKPRAYPSVFSLFPDQLRATAMQAVGRLDADTTGVLLITNDGGFNHRMTSPKSQVAKVYLAGLKHAAAAGFCQTLRQGVLLHEEQETVAAEAAELVNPHMLRLTITEGRYHQVKRMVAAAGNRVETLHRERFGPWDTQDLAAGQWRFVRPQQAASADADVL